jgi:hypothetical protein
MCVSRLVFSAGEQPSRVCIEGRFFQRSSQLCNVADAHAPLYDMARACADICSAAHRPLPPATSAAAHLAGAHDRRGVPMVLPAAVPAITRVQLVAVWLHCRQECALCRALASRGVV